MMLFVGTILARVMRLANYVLAILSLGILCHYFFGGDVSFFEGYFDFLGVLQLLALPLLIAHALFFVYWIFKKPKRAFLSLFILGLSYYSFGDFFKWHYDREFSQEGFTVMTYNVKGFNRFEWIKTPKAGDSIAAFIKKVAPDILCIQEHSRIRYQQLKQYPFRVETPPHTEKSIQAIFSQYPIVGEGSLDLPKSANNIIYADIVMAADTIRVYNVHLESFNIVPDSTYISDSMPQRVYQKMKTTMAIQREQAMLLKAHISKSPHRVLVCGDFNNTQFSRVYRIISKGMRDSFQAKGSGWGATYRLEGLPVRIDYIVGEADDFKFLQHVNYKKRYSDHEPIMAQVRLVKHE